MTQNFYAHSFEGRPPSEWQPLDEHLGNLAEVTRSFGEHIGKDDPSISAGLWNDQAKDRTSELIKGGKSKKAPLRAVMKRTGQIGLGYQNGKAIPVGHPLGEGSRYDGGQ